eukprot:3893863-Alexandrium_andersonii.AAC.1
MPRSFGHVGANVVLVDHIEAQNVLPRRFECQGLVSMLKGPHAGHQSGMGFRGQKIPSTLEDVREPGQMHSCLQP